MSSFFNDLKDIRLTVMESLPEIAQMNNLSGWVSGDDIPDINGLINEVTELREKIKDLEKDNNQLRMNKSRESNTNNYQELIQLLESIKVKVPENVSKQSAEMELTLLQLYKNSSDYIITGITNAFGVSDGESFLYHNRLPS